jgi:hypothetical protein
MALCYEMRELRSRDARALDRSGAREIPFWLMVIRRTGRRVEAARWR